jgi:hypothetical protein
MATSYMIVAEMWLYAPCQWYICSHVDAPSLYMNVSRLLKASVVSHCSNAENLRLGEQTSESVTTLLYAYIMHRVSSLCRTCNIIVTVTNLPTNRLID